ncbi:MAG TPA: thymidylate synthase [Candidatus Saccharimonadia bacterium]|nr:thymidylate synthase [Candidatus Saccharimonadia bacterium]
MKVIEVRNVAAALPAGLSYLLSEGVLQDSRAGRVVVAPQPVTTVYSKPCERVLFSTVRDANPYFHLLESCWMLAGRDDATFLDPYVKDFSSRFAEEGGIQAGAYGHRWRHEFGFDQLDAIVDRLRVEPTSRQCVLQMWDARSMPVHGIGADDLLGKWRDRPCNTHVYFRMRRGELDMLVSCRSNDIIMGAYGANAVHFSFLQEYLAGRLGVPVGLYWQLSWDYHAYVADIERLARRAKMTTGNVLGSTDQAVWGQLLASTLEDQRYARLNPYPIVTAPDAFDADLDRLMHYLDWLHADSSYATEQLNVKNTFLTQTVSQAAMAHQCYKEKLYDAALALAQNIEAEDWRVACVEWLKRRKK